MEKTIIDEIESIALNKDKVKGLYAEYYYCQYLKLKETKSIKEDENIAQKLVQLETQLTGLNVFDMMFTFAYHSNVASVNGYRLTKCNGVLWNEVNMGLGLIAQTLLVMANKIHHSYKEIIPVSNGAASYFIKTKDQVEIKLYYSVSLTVFSKNNNLLNVGLICVLYCLDEILQVYASQEKHSPYKITKDKIHNVSIRRPPTNTESDWELAMRYVAESIEWAFRQ